MAVVSESIAKSIPLNVDFRIKTVTDAYAPISVEGRPIYDVDFATKDVMTSVQNSLKQTPALDSTCHAIALIANPAMEENLNSFLERRQYKSQEVGTTPLNLDAVTTQNNLRRHSTASLMTPSTLSHSSPLSSISSPFSPASCSEVPHSLRSFSMPLSASSPVDCATSVKQLNDVDPRTQSLLMPHFHHKYAGGYDLDVNTSSAASHYWKMQDNPMLMHRHPMKMPLHPGHYNVPYNFYMPSGNSQHVQHSAMLPEIYEMNRLHMMGQEQLPPIGMPYSPYHQQGMFGYKYPDMLPPFASQGAYYWGGPRSGMRGGRRKSRYRMGMEMPGMGGCLEHVCSECYAVESPEWRKGPKGPKTLCNACGLRWAKKSRKDSTSTPKSKTKVEKD